ncbi:DUF3488 and transglutaminase-like domain-containing protein [Microbacterium elymi]|uniref:DUF3488 and transglutaminase-like domain-containing protein n=1 Tax=Microbacterium elymi TaxID=2909587 RepID=A0ABY5NNM2_9MICO|nr:DUF3488 and transglutaminase-like domain-containing protein [Microbacterium elymi]UUT36684.1 DUF3488 and transglutaminase-like domain-containing protein [Microbacterium elymi]
MAATERTPRRRTGAQLSLTIGSWVAVLAAMVPLLNVITPGAWIAGVVGVTAAVFAAGFIARWYRLPAAIVALIEIAVWIALVTAVFLREAAIVFVIPTLHAFRLVPDLVGTAMYEIQVGIAPMAPSEALTFCLVAAAGAVAIVVDHTAITARMPLAAAIALVAVSLIPSLAVPAPFDVIGFVLLAAAILFLLRAETRTRYRPPQAVPSAPSSTSAIALAIGLVAVLVAVAATPLLPEPTARAGFGPVGTTINASLDLGKDLRRPDPVTVLSLRTSATSAPYLRVATLSRMEGAVWKPDVSSSDPLNADATFDDVSVNDDITVTKQTTRIHIDRLTARYLPVPFPAVQVKGTPKGWEAMTANRTIVANGATTSSGQEYEVVTEEPQPTLEQIRAAAAGGTDADYSVLPGQMPSIITDSALSVTADATDDYDRLIALQNWFRGSEFEYSLTAPAQSGFDSSGVSSIADFLREKSGYCIHFASAFAIMARVLGMPSRIVVGYLPGTADTASLTQGKPMEYYVSSAQLHAWPEVHFSGIGWIPFEPTKSLGSPTSFLPAAAGGAARTSRRRRPRPRPRRRARPIAPIRTGLRADDANTGSTTASGADLPALGLGAAGLVVLLLIPSLLGRCAAADSRRPRAPAMRWRRGPRSATSPSTSASPCRPPSRRARSAHGSCGTKAHRMPRPPPSWERSRRPPMPRRVPAPGRTAARSRIARLPSAPPSISPFRRVGACAPCCSRARWSCARGASTPGREHPPRPGRMVCGPPGPPGGFA